MHTTWEEKPIWFSKDGDREENGEYNKPLFSLFRAIPSKMTKEIVFAQL